MVRLKRAWVRPVVAVVFTGFIVLFCLQNWQAFGASIGVMRRVPLGDFGLSLVLFGLTFVMAAGAYSFLAFRRLGLRELLLVELAAAAINRLVPSGLGGLGVHGLYLHKRRHTVAQATAVVSSNNLLGMLVHLSLLGLVLATGSAGEFHLGWHAAQGWVLWGVVALCAVALLVRPLRRKLTSFGRNLLVSLKHYEQQPHKLAYAALALLSLTLLNVAVLYLAARSFGVWLDLPALFVVYTAGVFVGAAVPTPGGLAGVEAGLVGGCMAYGVTSTTAIAIALAFRLVTYWFPLAPALLALYTSRRLRLI